MHDQHLIDQGITSRTASPAGAWPRIDVANDPDHAGPCVTAELIGALTDADLGPGRYDASFGWAQPRSLSCFEHAVGVLNGPCGAACPNPHKHAMSIDPHWQIGERLLLISCQAMAALLNAGPAGGPLVVEYLEPWWFRFAVPPKQRAQDTDNFLEGQRSTNLFLDDRLEGTVNGLELDVAWRWTEPVAIERIFFPRWAALVQESGHPAPANAKPTPTVESADGRPRAG